MGQHCLSVLPERLLRIELNAYIHTGDKLWAVAVHLDPRPLQVAKGPVSYGSRRDSGARDRGEGGSEASTDGGKPRTMSSSSLLEMTDENKASEWMDAKKRYTFAWRAHGCVVAQSRQTPIPPSRESHTTRDEVKTQGKRWMDVGMERGEPRTEEDQRATKCSA
ncbi:hypothetical protein LY76DRAFT_103299 [Colletotrichum caudatum]|nr:hypothetical protein LY76DRAFT_103299 [Colletotrichum caudatum]